MLRRCINMSDDRINKKVFLWSKVQNSPRAAEIHAVFEGADIKYIYINNLSSGINKINLKTVTCWIQ